MAKLHGIRVLNTLSFLNILPKLNVELLKELYRMKLVIMKWFVSLVIGLWAFSVLGQPVVTGIVGPPRGLLKDGRGTLKFLIKGDVAEHCLLANNNDIEFCQWLAGPPPETFHFKVSGTYTLSLWLKDQMGNLSRRTDSIPLKALYAGTSDNRDLKIGTQLVVFFDNAEPVVSVEQDFTAPVSRSLASEGENSAENLDSFTFSLDMFAFSKSYVQSPHSR